MAFLPENVSQDRGCGINDRRLLIETGSGGDVTDHFEDPLDMIERAQRTLKNGQGIEYAGSGTGLTLSQVDCLPEASGENQI